MLNKSYLVFILFLLISIFQISSYAQYYFFGRNKVQYEEFDWKVMRTDHFDIYYYGEFEEVAEIGANYAEEAYKELKVKFNHYLTRKIPLIFYNTHIHFQQTNVIPIFLGEGIGGFFEHMKGRVVVPYQGDLESFKSVIKHELVHVYVANKVANVKRDHRVAKTARIPLWFNEGIADYWSEQFDTQGEMVMRDAVLNNIIFGIQTFDRLGLSYFIYKLGQYYLAFISETYGEEKLVMFLENTWRFTYFTDVVEFILGESAEEIDNKWFYWLRQKYYPLVTESYPHHIIAKKETDVGAFFNPNVFEDENGKYAYFVGNVDGYSSVFKVKLNKDNRFEDTPEIVVRGEKESIFESFHIMDPSIAVSSKGVIAFVTKSKGSDVIHLYSIKDKKVYDRISFDRVISMNHPSFSKDGNKLLFSGTDVKGFTDVFLTTLDKKELKRITNDFYSDTDPIFSANEKRIIFASNRTEGEFQKKYNLFTYDLDSHKIDYLTYSNSNISLPKYSPDGQRLFFISDQDGTNNLWEIELDANGEPVGMNQRSHFLTSLYNYDFADNNSVITSAFENFSFNMYSLKLDNVPDSLDCFERYSFSGIGEKWIPEKLSLNYEFKKYKYDNEYSLDYAFSQFITDPVYGARGGGVLSLSDILGDDRYLITVYNTAELQSELIRNLNVAVTRMNLKGRVNYAYGIFHFSGQRYDIREYDGYFYERSYGGFFSTIYPFSSFQRFEASVSIANQDRELDVELIGRKSLLISNSLSYVHDNSIWGATGPVDGSRLRVLLGYTSDVKYSNVNYYSFIFDYRKYFRLHRRVTLATRGGLFYNHGKEARRYFAGGSWDLRGWRRWSIRGEKLWLSSVELRFPLINQFILRLPFIDLGFANIRGAAFFDAGGAWDEDYKETLGSIGAGVRINLGGAISLRYDIGKKIENNFSQFQPRLFYQFFFGWDF